MTQSAFEKEMDRAAATFSAWTRSHDRGVMLGLLLGGIPVPPINLAGLMLTSFNYYLLRVKKLDYREARLIRISALVAVISLTISVGALYALVQAVSQAGDAGMLASLIDWVREHLDPIWSLLFNKSHPGSSRI